MSTPVPIARRLLPVVAGVAVAALLAWGAWYGFETVASLPVKRVVYTGDVERLPQADLEALSQAIQAAPGATLAQIRTVARRVPWARDAAVRRVFPDSVEVTFEAHEAFARWNENELVSREGIAFKAPRDAGALPRLRGPEGSAAQVVREYAAIAEALAPIGSPLAELRLSSRGSWHATLASGLAVALGRGDWRPRAERFVAAWPRLAPEARASSYADLRYPNGFALKRAATLTVTKP